MDIKEVEKAIKEHRRLWKKTMPAVLQTYKYHGWTGVFINSCILTAREEGFDLSWFDENYKKEMSFPEIEVTLDDLQKASPDEIEMFARIDAINQLVYELIS
jgi:hypothetical protein